MGMPGIITVSCMRWRHPIGHHPGEVISSTNSPSLGRVWQGLGHVGRARGREQPVG